MLASPQPTSPNVALVAAGASRVAGLAESVARQALRGAELCRPHAPRGAFTLHDDFARTALRLSGSPIWKTHERSGEQTRILLRVLEAVRKSENPVVVFNLDDTVVCNLFREIAILRDCGRKFNAPLMTMIGPEHLTTRDLKAVLIRNLRLDPAWVKTHIDSILDFHRDSLFFNLDYQKYTVPLPGAAAYVRALKEAGARIVYLSARVREVWEPTVAGTLRRHGFPLPGDPKVSLILKPKFYEEHIMPEGLTAEAKREALILSDMAFKRDSGKRIRELGKVAAAFDNEPGNINLLRKEVLAEDGVAVFLDTTHWVGGPIDPGIVTINGFLL